jgi:hypothetical protein
VILLFGVLLVVSDHVLFIGRNPGGIGVPGDVWTSYAPLVTATALSVGTAVLSLMAWMRLKENP